jgi:hypothetical protein
MKQNKVSVKQVLSDDMDNPFWSSLQSNPNYASFEQEIDHIIDQSKKHGKPYVEICRELNDE